MNYSYYAYTTNKTIVKGTITASSEEAATEKLVHQGYRVLSLKRQTSFELDWEKLFPSLFQVKVKTVIFFTRQLALLLESGTDIIGAIELLRVQSSNRIFRKILAEVDLDLRSGKSLSAALSKHPDVFPVTYCRSLSAGEQTGGLDTMLRQIADYMEREVKSRKGLKSALKYPITVSIVAFIVIIVLVTFVMPTFIGLYKTMGTELPLPTKVFIAIVDILRAYGLYMLGIAGVAALAIALYIRTPEGKYRWHKLALTLPMVGEITLLGELAYCCQTMSMLFHSGVPLLEIMDIVAQSSGNKVMQETLIKVKQSAFEGKGLSRPMSENPLFLPLMVQMIKVGEETGSLALSLTTVAQAYNAEVEDKTQSLIGFIQPALTLAIGIVVAFIAISMLSAMFGVYGQMG